MSYKAFISYSHAADGKLAPALQTGLQDIGKPIYRPGMRVFRDDTSLQLTPALWPRIQDALRESEHFVLMSSPEAARSKWVQREIDEWLNSKKNSLENFSIVLTEGEIVWDESANDFDWEKTTALPRNLQAKFSSQPFYLDFRWAKTSEHLSIRNPEFLNSIGKLAAAIRKQPLDSIIGEDVKRHRRFRLVALGIIAALFSLLVTATYTALEAKRQTNIANEQKAEADRQRDDAIRARNETKAALDRETRAREGETQAREQAETRRRQAEEAQNQAEKRRKEAEEANEKETIAKRETEDTKKAASRTALLESGREQLTNHNPFQAAAYLSRAYTLWRPDEESKEPGKLSTLRLLMGLAMRSVDSLRYKRTFTENVVSAKFSPKGNRIAIACADDTRNTDNTARVLDVNTGEDVIDPVVHTWDVNTAEFSLDGNRIVTSSDDDSAKVLDLRTGALTSFKHPVAVKSARFSPDAKQIATVDRRGRAVIWDIKSGLPTSVLEAKQILASLERENLKSVEFSPDMKQIVIVDYDGGVIVCDFETQKVVASLIPKLKVNEASETTEGSEVNSARFSPDGEQLVIAGDKTAKVLDLKKTPGSVITLQHQNAVISAEFSPDSRRIVTITSDQKANIWDLKSRKLVTSLQHQDVINSAKFSPNGAQIVTASDDKTSIVWDVETGKVFALMQHYGFVKSAEFSPNGRQIVTVSHDKTVRLWNVVSEVIASVPHGENVISATFSNYGQRMVTASWDKTAKVLDLNTGAITELKHEAVVRTARFSHDGNLIVTCSGNIAKMWDFKTQKVLPEIPKLPHYGPCWSAEFSPDDKQIVVSSGNGTAEVLDLETKRIISLRHPRDVNTARFSPDGSQIVTASSDGTAKVWDLRKIWDKKHWDRKDVWVATPESVVDTVPHEDIVMSAVFSPNGKLVATASKDGTAKIFSLETHKVVATIEHQALVISAEFSPDGKWLVTASNDGTATIWDVDKNKVVYAVQHNGRVRSARFSPDSKQFVTASADRTTKVWDVETGKLLASIAHEQLVRSAEFSPDGQRIATASFDRTAKVWWFPRETRTRDEIEAIVKDKVPFRLEELVLVPRQDVFRK